MSTNIAKTALISGGARGIGRCLVRRFLELGYKVYILDINEEELDHTARTHLKKYFDDGKVQYSVCDLRNVDEIRSKVEKAGQFLDKHIDVLINNGGIASPKWADGKMMDDFDTIEQWRAYVDTNLTAPFAVSQACLPFMKLEEGGTALHLEDDLPGPCIIHIGSFRAYTSDANQEGYAATKAGQIGLMHSMAVSLQKWGIRVNLIAPGRIKATHESKEGDENGIEWLTLNEEKDVDDHLSNRAGRPKDIADAAEYLVGAGFVTGQEIVVDGGATKKKS